MDDITREFPADAGADAGSQPSKGRSRRSEDEVRALRGGDDAGAGGAASGDDAEAGAGPRAELGAMNFAPEPAACGITGDEAAGDEAADGSAAGDEAADGSAAGGEAADGGAAGGEAADGGAAGDEATGGGAVGDETADDGAAEGHAGVAVDAGAAAEAGTAAPDEPSVDVGISAAEAAAALAGADDTVEIDEFVADADAEGLPPVPELADAAAVARIVFVLLLTQRDGLSLLRLAQACNTTQKVVEQALPLLQERLLGMSLPVELARTGDSVKFLTSAEVFPFLQRLRGVKKLEKLSPAALETLAVIAYRQPVMRAEIEAIRGVKAGPMLRTLLSHKLVRVTGRADVPGRPLQYGTTDQFLERFGLASLQELPSVKEWKQLG